MRIFKTITLLLFTLVAIAAVGLTSCSPKLRLSKSTQETTSFAINQQADDLLAGLSNAVCYSGFRSGQHPDRGDGAKNPTDEQILEDLKILSQNNQFSLIRLYDSGENSATVLRLIQEHKINMKVMLGVWLHAELSNHLSCAWLTEPIPQKTLDKNKTINASEIKNAIELANKFQNIVVAVNVGNEALVDWNDHKVDVDTLISYVHQVKKSIKQAVTVAENYEWWAANGTKLAKELDFIAIHIYPIWENKDIEDGIAYSIENVQKVRNALPNAKIVISEAGWATIASEFADRASEQKQTQYYKWLNEWSLKMNITTFFFEAFDEDWKGETANPLGAEKHWGLYNVDRTAKKVMK